MTKPKKPKPKPRPPHYIHVSAPLVNVKDENGMRRTLVRKGTTLRRTTVEKRPKGMTKKRARRLRIKHGHDLRRWQLTTPRPQTELP